MARERRRRRSVARGCWVNDAPTVGFVLGGGGLLGAAEVGMLRAFFERQRRPDLVVGTSVGALHGAMIAAEPTIASVDKLEAAWRELLELGMLSASWLTGAAGLLRTRTHVRSNAPFAASPPDCSRSKPSSSSRSRFSASPPASSAPRSTGSAQVRSSTRSSPPPPFLDCCRRSRSAASTSSTAAS